MTSKDHNMLRDFISVVSHSDSNERNLKLGQIKAALGVINQDVRLLNHAIAHFTWYLDENPDNELAMELKQNAEKLIAGVPPSKDAKRAYATPCSTPSLALT
jgi:hypothetical protein